MLRAAIIHLLSMAVCSPARDLPSGDAVIQSVQRRLEDLYDRDDRFFYTRTNLILHLDPKGKTEKTTEKVYNVQIFNGLPRARLIQTDGRRLSEQEQKEVTAQEERFQKAIVQEKSPDYARPKSWLTDEIRARFVFTTTGRTNYDGRSLLLLTFAVAPNAPDKSVLDRVINSITGFLWIDEREFEIARMDLHMLKPVKFWGGIVGQLDGFDYSLLRRRSELGAWFNHSGTGSIRFRRLWSRAHLQINEHASDLRSIP